MSIVEFLALLLIATLCGMMGQALAGYSIGGCVISTIVGFFGALVGLWLARQLGLPELLTIRVGRNAFPVLWSIIGSAILSVIAGLLTRRRGWAA